MHTEFSWAVRETELSRAQGEGDYLSDSLLFSLVPLLAVGLFSLKLKRPLETIRVKGMCVCVGLKKKHRDSIIQLTLLTRSQGSACGRPAKVEKEQKSPWPIMKTWRHTVSGGRGAGHGRRGCWGWETVGLTERERQNEKSLMRKRGGEKREGKCWE